MTRHHLHTVIVSFNRRSLTERTLTSYLDTVTVPHTLVVVDNGSQPDVVDWLQQLDSKLVTVLLLGENRFPGYATNRGWELMPAHTTLLQRIDNDTRYLPGWCDEMLEAFEDPGVGQFGPIAEGDEQWTSMPVWPVGGNSIIRRELYDAGLRYSEEPWSPTWDSDDSVLTRAVWAMGYERRFGTRPGIAYMDDGDVEYREWSHRIRGLEPKPWGTA